VNNESRSFSLTLVNEARFFERIKLMVFYQLKGVRHEPRSAPGGLAVFAILGFVSFVVAVRPAESA
jgi:hypothetical protein